MLRLVTSVAGTGPVLDEHVNDNDEILPHSLMADLRRWFVNAVGAGKHRGVSDFLAYRTYVRQRRLGRHAPSSAPQTGAKILM
jgi:hypothetical protein